MLIPKVNSFGKSDIGLKRLKNEDAFVLKPELGLFSVADGMGGAAAGALASSIFAAAAIEIFSNTELQFEQERVDAVNRTFSLAHERIRDSVRQNPRHHGMGCTAELLVLYNKSCILGHVGDSRIYLFRGSELRQLTKDHSFVQNQIDQGLITAAAARKHRLRNVIHRAVGIEENLAVDVLRGKTLPGDIFLLCSDGLTDMVDDMFIQETLLPNVSLQSKVERLIELANSAGGYDNVTVILCEIAPGQ
jgi:serine/threonine protein phosphatase PrpC